MAMSFGYCPMNIRDLVFVSTCLSFLLGRHGTISEDLFPRALGLHIRPYVPKQLLGNKNCL